MPRTWRTLTINFGLINIEVGVAPAIGSNKTQGHWICREHKERLSQQYVCPVGDHVVTDKVKGYDYNGTFVPVEAGDLQGIEANSDKTIKLETFVDIATVDPVYLDKTYLIWPKKEALKAGYALLSQAMQETNLAGVGVSTLDKAARPVAIRFSPVFGTLVLHTAHYHEDVRWDNVKEIRGMQVDVPNDQVKMAKQVIAASTGPWELDKLTNEHETRLKTLIEAVAEGLDVPKSEPQIEDTPDVLAGLKAMLEGKDAR